MSSFICSPLHLLAFPPLSEDEGLYIQKRVLATNIGSAFHEILEHFKDCKTIEDKKNQGSDMINTVIGYNIRGRFCSAVAHFLLDGMKVQRFAGLMTYDVWKLVLAFVQEGLCSSMCL